MFLLSLIELMTSVYVKGFAREVKKAFIGIEVEEFRNLMRRHQENEAGGSKTLSISRHLTPTL